MKLLKVLSYIFLFISLLGFGQSTLFHINIVLSPIKKLDYELLFPMVFVVWIPAVFLGRMMFGDSRERDDWKVIFQFSPIWMKFAILGIFSYSFINGLFCIVMNLINSFTIDSTEVFHYWHLRGISSGMMLFYSGAAVIYYSFLQTRNRRYM